MFDNEYMNHLYYAVKAALKGCFWGRDLYKDIHIGNNSIYSPMSENDNFEFPSVNGEDRTSTNYELCCRIPNWIIKKFSEELSNILRLNIREYVFFVRISVSAENKTSMQFRIGHVLLEYTARGAIPHRTEIEPDNEYENNQYQNIIKSLENEAKYVYNILSSSKYEEILSNNL